MTEGHFYDKLVKNAFIAAGVSVGISFLDGIYQGKLAKTGTPAPTLEQVISITAPTITTIVAGATGLALGAAYDALNNKQHNQGAIAGAGIGAGVGLGICLAAKSIGFAIGYH